MRRWGRYGWRLIVSAVWVTPLVPWMFVLRAVDRRRPVFWWLLAGLGVWLLGAVAVLTRVLRWEIVAAVYCVWSALGGAGCAVAAQAAARAGWLASAPAISPESISAHRGSWRVAAGCGVLVYCLFLSNMATVWMVRKVTDWSIGGVLPPSVLLWACPGLLIGLVLGMLWQRHGAVTGKVLANFFIGTNLIALGSFLLLIFLRWAYRPVTPPDSIEVYGDSLQVLWGVLGMLFTPMVVYAYYVGLAPRIAGLLGRTLGCLMLFLMTFVQSAFYTGDQGLLYRYWAIQDERADDPATRLGAVRNWQRYLAVFPDATERADVLWRIATGLANVDRQDAAREAYGTLAALPEDQVQRPDRVRHARQLLQRPPAQTRSSPAHDSGAWVVEHADYLDDGWRSVLGFLEAGQPELPTEAFMAKLRALSLAPDQFTLPSVTNLFEVQAYGHLLGVDVAVQPLSLEQVKAVLASGRPVLIRRQDQWMCLVGFDPAWRTIRYYDYGRETERLRKRHQQEEAKILLSDSVAQRRERLRALHRHLLEECPEEDVAQVLADRHGLAATLRDGEGQDDQAVTWFLLGESAFDAQDPIAALRAYAAGTAANPDATWLLPYVHVARLAAEEPPRDVVARKLLPQGLMEELTQWTREPGHEDLLMRAQAAFEAQELQVLSAPILERLLGLLQLNVPEERTRLIRGHEILLTRYPEDVSSFTVLAEAYRQEGRAEPSAAAYQRLHMLEPTEVKHAFRLADTLLQLERPADAETVLRRMRGHIGKERARYLGLAGRSARLSHRYRRAVRLLRQALQANLADPELRCELALALDSLGRHDQALREWQWVAFASVNPTHQLLAKQRLAAASGGGR